MRKLAIGVFTQPGPKDMIRSSIRSKFSHTLYLTSAYWIQEFILRSEKDLEPNGAAVCRGTRHWNALNPATGAMPCTDDNYQLVYNSFQRVRHPFILTPGDNDWTDCHFLKSPTFDPIDRLAKVRTMVFPEGRSLGRRTIEVESQAKDPQYKKFVENLRWSFGGVTFVTVHIVGSNDNFGRTLADV